MSYIINPYRFAAAAPSGDFVEISTSATQTVDSSDGDYKWFKFDSTTASAFTVTDAGGVSGSNSIEVYCIGGGAGGGDGSGGYGMAGGGGGAGGYIRETSFNNGTTGLAQTYDVTIGGGGGSGANGNDSQLKDTVSRSADFDGTGDYISGGTNAAWGFGTGAFTAEAWINIDALPGSTYSGIISTYDGTNTPNGWVIELVDDAFSVWTGSSRSSATSKVPSDYIGKWAHLALVRTSTSSNDSKLYLNGELILTTTMSSNFASGNNYPLWLAGEYSSGYFLNGQMSCVRLSDSARYSSDFTPPFEQFEDDANTILLVQPVSSDSGWVDLSSSPKTLTGVGDVAQSTSVPNMLAAGGGAGGADGVGGDGGSGGGGEGGSAGGTGLLGQGKDGGTASSGAGGGGGGAGAVGADGVDDMDGGDGGVGVTYSWMNSNSLGADSGGYYAGGGGGGGDGGEEGTGGTGGGGDGGAYAGTANSGGGGGGGNMAAEAGGSGKVIVRYKFQ
tara:strand:+ start:144 stop:1646 length:1503 start_codon:yes stop_codon:yes gene_type:complete